MATYTVIWRADAASITSIVETDRPHDTITPGEWVDMAHMSEMIAAGYTAEEMTVEPKPSAGSYDLFGVTRGIIDWIA